MNKDGLDASLSLDSQLMFLKNISVKLFLEEENITTALKLGKSNLPRKVFLN